MVEVTRISGGPGTGKTTKCIEVAEREIDNGLDPERLLYVTYTTGAAQEARERVEKELDMSMKSVKDNWRNLHSLCFELLDLTRQDTAHPFREDFCKKYLGIDYSQRAEQYNADEIGGMEQKYGNKVFSIYDYMRSANRDYTNRKALGRVIKKKAPELFAENDPSPSEVMKRWEAFKIEKGLVDFTDMLEGVLRLQVIPDTDVMIVDEFQDISPLDYRVYSMWRDSMKRVYIAGDSNQALYLFRSADPRFLQEERHDHSVLLKETYRVPRVIWEEADKIVSSMDSPGHHDIEPRQERGKFVIKKTGHQMSDLEEKMYDVMYGDAKASKLPELEFNGLELLYELMDGCENDLSSMALFRTNYLLQDFLRRLRREGIPFRVMKKNGYQSWTRRVTRLRNGIRDLHKKGKVSGQRKRAVTELLKDSIYDIPRSEVPIESGEIIRNKAELLIEPDLRTERSEEYPLNWYEATAIVNNLEKDRMDIEPSEIRVGTKHSSKGQEADLVVTSFDTSYRIGENNYTENLGIRDREKRVDFVALTRAREKLFIKESIWDGVPNHTLNALQR